MANRSLVTWQLSTPKMVIQPDFVGRGVVTPTPARKRIIVPDPGRPQVPIDFDPVARLAQPIFSNHIIEEPSKPISMPAIWPTVPPATLNLYMGSASPFAEYTGSISASVAAFSVSLWCWINSYPVGSAALFSVHNPSLSTLFGAYPVPGDSVQFNLNGALGAIGSFPTSQWANLIFTADATVCKIYLNGVLKATYGVGLVATGLYRPELGADQSAPTYPDDWFLSDYRIFGRALTSTEATTIAGPGSPDYTVGPIPDILWWKCDEGAGQTLFDSSGNSYDTDLSNNLQWLIP